MYFSEPLTDLRTTLYADVGQSVDVDFNVSLSVWRLTVDKGFSRETLREMVRYLHGLFYYPDEVEYLDDWLKVVDEADLTKRNTLTLKTVDRIGT